MSLANRLIARGLAVAFVAIGSVSPALLGMANALLSVAESAFAERGAELALPLRILHVQSGPDLHACWAVLAIALFLGLSAEWANLGVDSRSPFTSTAACVATLVALVSLIYAVFVTTFLMAEVIRAPQIIAPWLPGTRGS